jgi:hypothetical protein
MWRQTQRRNHFESILSLSAALGNDSLLQKFENVALIDRQRKVNDCIKEEMKSIHAFSMKCWYDDVTVNATFMNTAFRTPEQWETKKTDYLK